MALAMGSAVVGLSQLVKIAMSKTGLVSLIDGKLVHGVLPLTLALTSSVGLLTKTLMGYFQSMEAVKRSSFDGKKLIFYIRI